MLVYVFLFFSLINCSTRISTVLWVYDPTPRVVADDTAHSKRFPSFSFIIINCSTWILTVLEIVITSWWTAVDDVTQMAMHVSFEWLQHTTVQQWRHQQWTAVTTHHIATPTSGWMGLEMHRWRSRVSSLMYILSVILFYCVNDIVWIIYFVCYHHGQKKGQLPIWGLKYHEPVALVALVDQNQFKQHMMSLGYRALVHLIVSVDTNNGHNA